ncbi:SagB/ThcOx family dehydrogenase [Chloroflexota bacterium]
MAKPGSSADSEASMAEDGVTIILPEPKYDGGATFAEVLLGRRSVRHYIGEVLTLQELSQLLWAAQGITDARGFRTAPSAGATYPLEVYAVVGDVKGAAEGIYRYKSQEHRLLKVASGEWREALARAALDQQWVTQGAVNIIITAIYERTTGHYGKRGIRYVDMEAGHAAQNVCLQAVALKLGTVVVGAFDDRQVAGILELTDNEIPLYIMPVGRTTD